MGRCVKPRATDRKRDWRAYDRNRGTRTERGYTNHWLEYSEQYRHEHPLCVMCETTGIVVAAACVDHIQPVSGPDDPRFWDETNHQSLCLKCHSRKTAEQDGGFGNRKT